MSDVDTVLHKSMSTVPECLAGGLVDLSTGMLMGIKTVDSHPQQVMDFLAAATADIFQGPNVVTIENAFKKARGVTDNRHYFQEFIITSDNLLHVMMRSKKNQDHVACFVCRGSVNIGMALTRARIAMTDIEKALS